MDIVQLKRKLNSSFKLRRPLKSSDSLKSVLVSLFLLYCESSSEDRAIFLSEFISVPFIRSELERAGREYDLKFKKRDRKRKLT
jgi:hypothetical protein